MAVSRIACAALLAAGLSATAAQAKTFQFSGSFSGGDPFFAGQTFSGSFAYDPSVSNSGSAVQAVYQAVTAFSFSLSGGDAGAIDGAATLPVNNVQVDDGDFVGNNFADRWGIAVTGSDLDTTLSNLFFVGISLFDFDRTAQDGIPAAGVPAPNLPEMDLRRLFIQFNDDNDPNTRDFAEGNISFIGAVPVPASLPLLIAGALGLGIVARAHRKT